jgi:hypothetical protein
MFLLSGLNHPLSPQEAARGAASWFVGLYHGYPRDMGLVNRRNAMLGWSVWQISKLVAKRKAKRAVPGRADDSMRPNKSAIAALLATAGGVLWFWRRRSGDTDAT